MSVQKITEIPLWTLVRDLCIVVSWLLCVWKNSNRQLRGKALSDIFKYTERATSPSAVEFHH